MDVWGVWGLWVSVCGGCRQDVVGGMGVLVWGVWVGIVGCACGPPQILSMAHSPYHWQ